MPIDTAATLSPFMTIIDNDINAILRENWRYDSFRPAQEEIITSILQCRDTIGLLPTGGGKSITFQVPALAVEGLTVVISPLISLMKDQVDNLRARGIKAVYLHSALTKREVQLAIDRCRLGKAKILYISPEKLASSTFIDTLRKLPVSIIVVDEAHCISQWGYDFRPSYLKIAALRKHFPQAPLLALTASATPDVVDDIACQLEMKQPLIQRLSFTRDNLSYIVRYCDDKVAKITEILNKTTGCAIVYVRSRKRTREIAETLSLQGISAEFYHAGLDPHEKEERQNRWKNDETRVIVATNAFGMGIDKPDVRIVIHADLPPSLEEYYQEAGRAGRDGLPSLAVIVASRYDKSTLSRRLDEIYPPKDTIRRIYTQACVFLDIVVGGGYNTINEFNLQLFCSRNKIHPVTATSALNILTRSGLIDFQEEISTRSRVMMLVTKEELYHLDLNATAENVLRQLLREYTGLFADYVYISEPVLAARLNLSEQSVYESMLLLARHKVLHYVPKKSSPYIFFPTSREEERHVVIPQNVYEERRRLMAHRLDAMKHFVYDTDRCRVATLLEYFGENNTSPCGSCDVCRSRRKFTDNRPSLQSRILHIVSSHPGITPQTLADTLGDPIPTVGAELRRLIDQSLITLTPDNTLHPTSQASKH